jgi:hypothetical protein
VIIRYCSVYVLFYPLSIAVVGIIRCHRAVIYLDEPLVLVVDILTGALCRGVSIVVITTSSTRGGTDFGGKVTH